ncbi:hypothetical protein F4775DRAFT_591877 [Biscogniauxia sp. FL1348]|nr:hypothetical protein F4775DRAFT_591877 [Biscogniauxia sp. FL1348]
MPEHNSYYDVIKCLAFIVIYLALSMKDTKPALFCAPPDLELCLGPADGDFAESFGRKYVARSRGGGPLVVGR